MEAGKAFLTVLEDEINRFDASLFQPRHEPDAEDKEVGTVSDYTRKFYALAMNYGRERDQIILDSKYDEHVCEDVSARAKELNAKYDILMGIFWYMVRTEHNLWAEENIGVRKDWKMVVSPYKPPKFPPGLKAIFGGLIPPDE